MITDAGSDYYQLCYDDDDVSLPDENRIIQEVNKKKEFLYEHYTSSPRLIRSKFKIEADNDFLTSCSEVLEEANSILYNSSEGYQPPSERYSSDLFRTTDGSMDSTALEESALPTPENTVAADFVLECEDDIDANNVYVYDDIEFQHNQRESPDHLLAKPNMDRRYTSSSGISAGSPTGSSASSLSMDIEKLQHVHSSGSIVSSTENLKRAKSCDSNQLWARSSSSRSSTPTGRKSPLLDFFLGKSKVYEFDDDFNVTKKKKQPKHKKSFDSVRSSSPFMFNLRKCSSLTSKDKFKNGKYSKSLPEVKKDLTNGVTDDSNTKRLQQPSPFVKTIFQYVESSFDDELYGISGFNTKNDSATPVFSCSNGKVLPEFKSNSLPRKNRNKNYLLSPIVKTITQNSQEPFLLSSGRRVSENSDFFISVVAYLDRIRKAQQKPTIASKRRPRQKRYRSDPGSVAKFLKDIEIPDEDKTMERHLFHETAPNQQNAVNKNNVSISLHKRFANFNDNPLLTSSSTGVAPSYSDPMINSISRSSTPTPKHNKNNSQLSRRTRSLKSIFTPFKKRNKETDKLKQRDSISLQLQHLCNLEDDLSNRQSQCNSRDSRSDLQNFIREFEQHENESQLFPISRTDCDLDLETIIRQNHIETEDICKRVDKNKIPYAYDNFTDLPSNLSDQMLAIELLRKLERLEQKQSCDVNIDKYEKRYSTSPETSVCVKDDTCEEGCYDKHNSEGVDLSSQFDYSSQLCEDIIAGTERDAWRENSSIIRRNTNSHENSPHQNMTLEEQLESPSIMEEVVDKPNKVSKRLKGKSKKKYGRSNSDDIEYWTGSFKNSPPRNRQGKHDKDVTENIKGKSVFNIRRQFESFRKKDKKEKVSKGAEENSNMELEKSRKVKKKSITKPPEDAKQESPDGCDYDSKRLASFSTIRSVFETQGQCTPPFNKLRTQSLVNKSLSNYQNDDHNRESDETSNSTECEDGVVNTPGSGSVLHAMKQKFEQLSEDAASPLLGSARKRCSPKQSSNSKEEVIKVNVDKSVYDDCLPLNKNEEENVECPTIETAIEDEDDDEKIGRDINEDEWCVLEDVIPTKQQAHCENEEEENIVVDVPSHLLPPEFVVGVPVSRSHLFREGSFRRVRTLASQYLKTSSNENISISSSDSNTDASENSKITTKVFQNASSTEYDSDVDEEEEMNVGVQEVDGDLTSNTTQFNSQEELCMDTETVTEENMEDSKGTENINFNAVPELFAESSCETVDLQSSEYPNQNDTDQYTSYSIMASNIYRDVSKLYGPNSPSSSTSDNNTVLPPVKPKPKCNTSKLQLGSSNVAMVSPFIKNESADHTDHPTAFASNDTFDTVKRREFSVFVMGKQWQVVNGKWVTVDDVVDNNNNNNNKYGSLDRKLYVKKKCNCFKKEFENTCCKDVCTEEFYQNEKSVARTRSFHGIGRRKNVFERTSLLNSTSKKFFSYQNHKLKTANESMLDVEKLDNTENDLIYGSLDRRILRKKKIPENLTLKKLTSHDKHISHGVTDLRKENDDDDSNVSKTNTIFNEWTNKTLEKCTSETALHQSLGEEHGEDVKLSTEHSVWDKQVKLDNNNNDTRVSLTPHPRRKVFKKVSEIGKKFEVENSETSSLDTFSKSCQSILESIKHPAKESETNLNVIGQHNCGESKSVIPYKKEKEDQIIVVQIDDVSVTGREATQTTSRPKNGYKNSFVVGKLKTQNQKPSLVYQRCFEENRVKLKNDSVIVDNNNNNEILPVKNSENIVEGEGTREKNLNSVEASSECDNDTRTGYGSALHSIENIEISAINASEQKHGGLNMHSINDGEMSSIVTSEKNNIDTKFSRPENKERITFDQNNNMSVTERRSAPPNMGRPRSNSFGEASKQRSNSTGHSPDIARLLQHLICDIEEEVPFSSDDETKSKKNEEKPFQQQQLDSFNSHLNEITSQSADSLNTLGETKRRQHRIHGRLRRTFSEDDVGLKLLREQRQKRKRISASGENVLARKPSVIWARVKKMEVSLVLDQDYKEPDIIAIESFNVRRVNTYKDIEELAVDTFLKHVQLFDKHALELTKYDIGYLQVGDHRIRIGDQFDISQAKIQDGFLPCRICIKGKKEWSLASLSYDTLISKSYLEKYISLILCHRHVMFYGPSGTGKSYLARRIAMFLNHRINEGTIPPVILKNLTPDRWKLLLNNLLTERRERQFVVVLDGFSQSFIDSGIDIGDVIATCQDLEMQPYIICTLTQHPNVVTPLQWQQNFRWIWQPNHEEPADGLLQKYLRRKFIHYGNQHLQRESFRVAEWLASTWRHINRIIEKYNSAEATIGATMFYTCPPDILTAEEWFVDLWNYSISPYFIQTVKQGLRLHGYRNDWEDPLEWILKTYPWVSEKAKRKMKLRRIRKEDVGYCVASSPDRMALSISSSEQQRLLGFLRQLEMLMLDGGLDDIPFVEDKNEEPYESFI